MDGVTLDNPQDPNKPPENQTSERGHHVLPPFYRDTLAVSGGTAVCARYERGACACEEPSPDSPRCYFACLAARGLRAIFMWDPARRWPDPRIEMPLTLIEGVTFRSAAAAARFDMSMEGCTYEETFDTWDEALAWLLDEAAANDASGKG